MISYNSEVVQKTCSSNKAAKQKDTKQIILTVNAT